MRIFPLFSTELEERFVNYPSRIVKTLVGSAQAERIAYIDRSNMPKQ